MARYSPGRPLTVKQAAFVQEYPVDWDGGKAVRRAKYAVKSDKSAWEIASQLLKLPQVQEALENEKKKLAAACGVSAERLMKEEQRIAFADIRKIFHAENYEHIPPGELPDEIAAAISNVKKRNRIIQDRDGNKTEEVYYEYSFWSKLDALDKLNRKLGLYDADQSQKANVRFIVCGTQGETIEDCMAKHGVTEVDVDG